MDKIHLASRKIDLKATSVIEMIKFWYTNHYNHPPLTAKILEAAEKELGVKLPEKLIDLLYIQNGAYTKGFVFPLNVKTNWADDHVPLSELFGIVLDRPTCRRPGIQHLESQSAKRGARMKARVRVRMVENTKLS